MTRKECVKAAIVRREADRVPYVIDICADAWARFAPLAKGLSCEAFLDNDVVDIPVPWWGWYELAEDWKGGSVPRTPAKVFGVNSYDATRDAIKAARDATDKYLLVRLYGIHFEMGYYARGIENFLADLAGEPDFTRPFLRRIIERNLVMMENFLHLPDIDGVLLGSDWGSQNGLLMSLNLWDDMIRPGEQSMYDLAHSCGKDVWVHSCGNIERLIPRLIEMGVNVLNPVQPEAMDLRALKAKYGRNLAFWGGISTQRTLPFGTPEEVKAEARAVRDLMAAGGGYIFSPSQSIQSDVPPQNLQALLEVARETRKDKP